jgi:hypothetical protein
MRKVALAMTLGRWKELVLTGRERAAEMKARAPDLPAVLDELEQRHERTSALEIERLRLRAEQLRVTREIRELRAEGDDLALRVCALIKSVFGAQSELLRQFGLRPKPTRYRRRSSSKRQESETGSK